MNMKKLAIAIWIIAVIGIIVLCVISVSNQASAKIIEEQKVETDKVEILSLNGTDWSNPDSVQGSPGQFFISQEGFLCQSQLVTFWNHGVQQSGRMCRLPNGAWRVLH
jgi:starvation-inducible outer membrane lipoprotein